MRCCRLVAWPCCAMLCWCAADFKHASLCVDIVRGRSKAKRSRAKRFPCLLFGFRVQRVSEVVSEFRDDSCSRCVQPPASLFLPHPQSKPTGPLRKPLIGSSLRGITSLSHAFIAFRMYGVQCGLRWWLAIRYYGVASGRVQLTAATHTYIY